MPVAYRPTGPEFRWQTINRHAYYAVLRPENAPLQKGRLCLLQPGPFIQTYRDCLLVMSLTTDY